MSNHEQCRLGWRFLGEGKPAQAQEQFAQVLARDPNYAAALRGLGWIEHLGGRDRQAETLLTRALQREGKSAEGHFHLGIVYGALERPEPALRSIRRAIDLDPRNPDYYGALATLHEKRGAGEEALAAARAALALNPTRVQTLAYLAQTFVMLNDLQTAVACGRKAVDLGPNVALAHVKLGTALQLSGELAEAEAELRHAIELNASDAEAHVLLAYILLKSGRMQEGWNEYEWRLRLRGRALPESFNSPRWDGSDQPGKTLVVQGEQGFGDTVHFARYLTMASQRGLRVVVRALPALAALLRAIEGVEQVIVEPAPPPPHDFHAAIMSLPAIFGTTVQTIPNCVPYVAVDPEKRAQWMARLAELPRPRVGLAWAGNPKYTEDRIRSVPPEALAPLAGLGPQVSWVSLQFERRGSPPLQLHDFTRELRDFSDTAALIDCLDLVIACDTVIAHLAGALAKPVWTMLPHVGEWRWLTDREDSPWYPTMRLLRQPSRGDWASVVRRIADDLRAMR